MSGAPTIKATHTDSTAPLLMSDFQGARVLIIGGLGLIGSAIARRLVALGAEVTILDALLPGSSANLYNIQTIRDRVRLQMGDMRTLALQEQIAGSDYVFNLAGQSSHAASMQDPIEDLDLNCRAQLMLLEACRRVNSRAVIVYASTRQIYGRPTRLPVDESHPLQPVDVNGIDKMAAEAYHLLYHAHYGLRTTALRLTNTYGPGMRIKDTRQMFVGIWLRRVLEGAPFEVWEGTQRRDFIYVDDAAQAFLLAASCPRTAGQALNVGGSQPVSLRQLAQLLIATNGGGEFVQCEFPEERRRIDIGDYFADDRRFRELTGWRASVTLEQGLRCALDYFREALPHYL